MAADLTKEVEFWVYVVALPSISIPGIIANLASVFVFGHPKMRSSFNILLGGLSLFDSFLLFVASILWAGIGLCETRLNLSACWFVNDSAQILFPLAIVLQFISVWTCVAISLERFLAVKFPLQCRRWVSNRRTVQTLALIILSGTTFCTPICFELERNTNGVLGISGLRHRWEYLIYRAYGHFAVMFVIPFMIMIVLNISVTISIRRAFRIQRNLMNRSGGGSQSTIPSNSALVEKERHATLTGITVTVTFLVFNILASINNFLEALENKHLDQDLNLDPTSTQYIVRRICVVFGTFFVAVNSTVNFVVYCAIGNKFRNMFLQIYCGHFWKNMSAATCDNRSAVILRQTQFSANNRALGTKQRQFQRTMDDLSNGNFVEEETKPLESKSGQPGRKSTVMYGV